MIRCKFTCVSRKEYKSGQDLVYDFEMTAVYGDSSPENKEFWKWTPSGRLNVSTVKTDTFKVGQDYYLDISEVL